MSDHEHPGRQHLDPRLLALLDQSEQTPWLFVKNLKAGDSVEIQTVNTLYTLKVLDPYRGEVLINSNGRHITQETPGFVRGTTLTGTGTMIKMDGITAGLRLVIFVEGKGELVLSPTREVRVNGLTVLPISPNERPN